MDNSWLWWRDGVIYQIYPRSFSDSNGDGIGDLPGIISRLDYLQTLGVDAIWLSPIYPSPDADFGYDVADYTAIDPRYGTMDDFHRLVEEAHSRNIRVVLDLVLNHTSDRHPWFKAARSSKDNPYHDWYLWQDPKPGNRVPNNWCSCFGGSGWEYVPELGQYYFHMFYKEQPDLNWRNPAVRAAMLDVFRFWLDLGVDGFRLDVFNAYFKDAGFRDNPLALGIRDFDRLKHVYDCDQPEMMALLGEIRALLDAFPERYAVGETFLGENDECKAAGYCGPNKLHAAFNFVFTNSGWNPTQFLHAIQRWEHVLPEDTWPNYVLSNHDLKRAATRYARGEDDARLKVAAALLLTLRGTPFLYYGEEIGMRDLHISRSQIQDPIGLRYWPFFIGRDGCRGPMQWDCNPNAGFSTGEPWLPAHPDFSERNVANQMKDPDSLFHFYRRMLQLRKDTPALRQGMFIPLTYEPTSVFAYLRKTADQTVLVALNFSRRKLPLILGSELSGSKWELLFSTHRTSMEGLKDHRLELGPYEVVIVG
jgi:alpha-glucosidase